MQRSSAGMPCPVCSVPLTLSERQGIEIDYCPQCRGVWLDRGELDKIIERSGVTTAPPPQSYPSAPPPSYPSAPPPSYGHPPPSYGHSYKKRPKSFLEELFD
jgi:Zn-finger nucleic acid-binding protein